jgi:hypothetical protein
MTRIDPPPQAGPSDEGARPADRLVRRAASRVGPGLVRLVRSTLRLSSDRDRHGSDAFTASPFSRLQLTQMLSLGADAMVTVALAGSLFFSISTHSARGRVALTLLITIAPFAVVAPLIGPLIDRMNGGRRAMIVASALGRAVACVFMARYIHGLGLFPAALLSLICSKTYSVAKAAIVPAVVVRNEDLVEANSKLAMAGAVAGFLAYVPGVPILKLFNAATVLRVDIVLYILCALSALRLQARPGASLTDDPEAPVVPHTPRLTPGALTAAALAMAALRFTVGFMVFLVAFAFRRTHAPVWWYGIALAGSVAGNLVGAAIAPRLKGRIREEHILLGSVLVVAAVGLLTIPVDILQRRPAASLLAVAVGLAAGTAKLAFDSLVQQDVPTARQGRAFGRFEAIFQLVWVLGGLVPVAIAMSLRVGDLAVTVLLAASAVIYLVANRLATLRRLPLWWPGVGPVPPPPPPETTVIGGAVGLPVLATDPIFETGEPTAPVGGPAGPEVGGPVIGDPVGERPDPGTSPGLARPPRLGPPPPLGGGAPAQ